MPTFTLKNIPETLFERVRSSAELHHRSINGEILSCLERSLGSTPHPDEILRRARELRLAYKGEPMTLAELRAARENGRP
ncbi:MAG TPA: Arc family DNA-binding protein [Thermoanaerobaculia bacterium]|jgi:plasmid stability protein|nr:Arc family DNA-binding protein [Thermoanaerobaculia bacterium]